MAKNLLLSFISTAFKIEEGEDEETNPGIYGKALAYWLSEHLNARSIAASEPAGEDFGWYIAIPSKPFTLYVACSNFDEVGHEWGVFAFAEGSFFACLFEKDQRKQAINALYQDIREILVASPEIKELKEELG